MMTRKPSAISKEEGKSELDIVELDGLEEKIGIGTGDSRNNENIKINDGKTGMLKMQKMEGPSLNNFMRRETFQDS